MVYDISYGEIKENWAQNWATTTKERDPFDVLEDTHCINFYDGSGWFGFHMWADKNCTDRIEIDWGSRAWKCKGKVLLELNGQYPGSVFDVDSVDPDKTYGVVFIEMS